MVELSNANEKNIGSYRYSPYGEELDPNASETADARSNPTRYAGQYLDQDSGLYYMRAREYDPETGRFLEQDPKEEELGEQDLSDYLYAEDDPTLLSDPSGLDPSFGGKTLKCKKNKLLCKLIYAVGYEDGCGYYKLRKALTTLEWRGIHYEIITQVAANKAKFVNSELGPDGPGYYLVGGGRTVKIEPPRDQTCGWVCSVGFATTQVLGCKSEKGCIVQGALFVSPIPPTKGLRLLKASSKLRKGLNLIRKAKTAVQAIRAGRRGFRGLEFAGEYGIRTYYQLRKAIAGKGLQAHHLIEVRFAKVMEMKSGQMLSIAVTKAEHQVFTNKWRSKIAYGSEGTGKATRESVLNAAKSIYSDYPAILKELRL
jgi:RHS repeat-associated protein